MADNGGGFDFGGLVDKALSAYTAVQTAKAQAGARRPPAPVNQGGFLTFGPQSGPLDAGLSDGEKVSAIFRSPVTWVALAALLVGVVYLVRR